MEGFSLLFLHHVPSQRDTKILATAIWPAVLYKPESVKVSLEQAYRVNGDTRNDQTTNAWVEGMAPAQS